MGMFLKFLKTLIPIGRTIVFATPNTVDDALLNLIEEILNTLPADESGAVARLNSLRESNKACCAAAPK